MRGVPLLLGSVLLLLAHAAPPTPSAAPSAKAPPKGPSGRLFSVNKRLLLFSRKKTLGPLKECWADMLRQGLSPDAHCYTTYINALSRCGAVREGMEAFESMRRDGKAPSAAAFCALIKGFVQLGDLQTAVQIEEQMERELGGGNARATRAILRGCQRGCDLELVRRLWQRTGRSAGDPFMAEAAASVLSQALLVDEAAECMRAWASPEQAAREGGSGRLACARAFARMSLASALLGEGAASEDWAGRALALRNRKSVSKRKGTSAGLVQEVQWQAVGETVACVKEFLSQWFSGKEGPRQRQKILRHVMRAMRRLWIGKDADAEEEARGLAASLRLKCGLEELSLRIMGNMDDVEEFLRSATRRDGTVRWRHFRPDLGNVECRVNIELGSGTGEWAQSQVLNANADRDLWVLVEQRVDRLWMSWARAVMRGAEGSMCFVCDDAESFFLRKVRKGSVSQVIARFPQPPVSSPHGQVWGEGDADGDHMLTANLFERIHDALAEDGNCTVITDNVEYARAIADNVAQAMQRRQGQAHCFRPGALSTRRASDPRAPAREGGAQSGEGVVLETRSGVHISRFKAGGLGAGTSWFDRLWGGGGHSNRYAILLTKTRAEDVHASPAKPSPGSGARGAFYS